MKKCLLFVILFFASAILAHANADSIIMQDDGSILLAIDNPVLGEATDTKKAEKPPVKVVPIVPANTQATVTVHPGTDKKVTVTVSEPNKKSEPPKSAPTPQGNVISTKEVDRVVVEGKDKSPVVTIAPSSQKGLSIEQGPVAAQTNLPIQIDAKTHTLSAPSAQGETVKLLLPNVVIQKLAGEGLMSRATPKISLQEQGNDVVYLVTQERKLFHTIPLPPSTVTVSNTTGISNIPLYSRIFGLFFR